MRQVKSFSAGFGLMSTILIVSGCSLQKSNLAAKDPSFKPEQVKASIVVDDSGKSARQYELTDDGQLVRLQMATGGQSGQALATVNSKEYRATDYCGASVSKNGCEELVVTLSRKSLRPAAESQSFLFKATAAGYSLICSRIRTDASVEETLLFLKQECDPDATAPLTASVTDEMLTE